jgi:membrane protease YdiL (CAAX protease family)
MSTGGISPLSYLSRFLILIGIVLVCMFVFGILGIYIVSQMLDVPFDEIQGLLIGGSLEEKRIATKVTQLTASIGAFIIGPLVYILTIRGRIAEHFRLDSSPTLKYLMYTLVTFAVVTPLLAFIAYYNTAFAQSLGFNSEKLMEAYEILAFAANGKQMMFNLVLMAVIPAIGEELLFRGLLLNLFKGMFQHVKHRKHIAVFVTAGLFALMHLNMYHVFGIFFMGIILGYLMEYTQNIIFPILLHFINNGLSVVLSYVEQQGDQSFKILDADYSPNILLVVGSLIATSFLIYIFNKKPSTV